MKFRKATHIMLLTQSYLKSSKKIQKYEELKALVIANSTGQVFVKKQVKHLQTGKSVPMSSFKGELLE